MSFLATQILHDFNMFEVAAWIYKWTW